MNSPVCVLDQKKIESIAKAAQKAAQKAASSPGNNLAWQIGKRVRSMLKLKKGEESPLVGMYKNDIWAYIKRQEKAQRTTPAQGWANSYGLAGA
jgi:hypothetical protein